MRQEEKQNRLFKGEPFDFLYKSLEKEQPLEIPCAYQQHAWPMNMSSVITWKMYTIEHVKWKEYKVSDPYGKWTSGLRGMFGLVSPVSHFIDTLLTVWNPEGRALRARAGM